MKRLCIGLAVVLVGYLLYKGLFLRAVYLTLLEKTGLDAMPAMLAALEDRSDPIRGTCFGYFARHGAEATGPLVEALQDNNPRRREGAALNLRAIALSHKNALPKLKAEQVGGLTRALQDDDRGVRVSAAIALWHVDRPSKEALSTLIASCQEHDRRVRYFAFHWLEEIGPDAKEAVPILTQLLSDKDELVSLWARNALEAVDQEEARRLGVR